MTLGWAATRSSAYGPRMRIGLALVALLVSATTACAAPAAPETAIVAPPPSTSTPTTTDAPEAVPTTTDVAGTCPTDLSAAAVVAVDGQHRALIDGDFEGALTYSSSAFRAGADPERFAMIIRSGYPFLLEPLSREVLNCDLASSTVTLIVRFRLDSGTAVDLAYRLIEEDGRLAIEAAGVLPPPAVDV